MKGTQISIEKKKRSIVAAVAIGCATSVVLLIMGAALITTMVADEKIRPETVGYLAITAQFFAIFLGTILSASMAGEKRGSANITTAALFLLIITAVNIFAYEGQLNGILITVLVTVTGSALSWLLKNKRKSRSKRYHNRAFR